MSAPPNVDAVVADAARYSLGLVTKTGLAASGVSRRQQRTLLDSGVLLTVAPGVFRHRAWPRSWQQSVLAAVLAAGDTAVASHMSAAALWRFDGIGRGAVEVSVPYERRPRSVVGTVHRSRDLAPVDVDRERPIPVTTPARTLLDIAPRLGSDQLEQAVDGAARDGLVWVPYLRWRLEELRRPGRRGVARLAAVLDRTDGRRDAETWLEQQALRLMRRAGLPAPRCQRTVRSGPGGVARLDLSWEDLRLVVEVDGHATHATRRQRQRDGERSARLVLAGWRVVRFTYEDVVERPGYVVATLRALLAGAA
jgi:very-short-patch-repair endonuclease